MFGPTTSATSAATSTFTSTTSTFPPSQPRRNYPALSKDELESAIQHMEKHNLRLTYLSTRFCRAAENNTWLILREYKSQHALAACRIEEGHMRDRFKGSPVVMETFMNVKADIHYLSFKFVEKDKVKEKEKEKDYKAGFLAAKEFAFPNKQAHRRRTKPSTHDVAGATAANCSPPLSTPQPLVAASATSSSSSSANSVTTSRKRKQPDDVPVSSGISSSLSLTEEEIALLKQSRQLLEFNQRDSKSPAVKNCIGVLIKNFDRWIELGGRQPMIEEMQWDYDRIKKIIDDIVDNSDNPDSPDLPEYEALIQLLGENCLGEFTPSKRIKLNTTATTSTSPKSICSTDSLNSNATVRTTTNSTAAPLGASLSTAIGTRDSGIAASAAAAVAAAKLAAAADPAPRTHRSFKQNM
jgi:hypothetical protein